MPSRLTFLSVLFLAHLVFPQSSSAEIKTITATGEYRMGDNDTRTDAKRFALLDAKRLALEQAGTYLESVTEVKNLQVTKDEIRLSAEGKVEVTEETTQDVLEGATHIVRARIIAKIDTESALRQVNNLRKNEALKIELQRLQAELDRTKEELEKKNQELASLKSPKEVEIAKRERQKLLSKVETDELLFQAYVALGGTLSSPMRFGTSTTEGRARARTLITQVLVTDSENSEAHNLTGLVLIEEGKYESAVREFELSLKQVTDANDEAVVRTNLGTALVEMGEEDRAVKELRTALKLKPDFAEAHFKLGAALMTRNFRRHRTISDEDQGIIEEFGTTLQLEPAHTDAQFYLALALGIKDLDAGKPEPAIAHFHTALALKPNEEMPHYMLADAHSKRNNFDEAINEYRKALQINPGNPWTHLFLGHSLVRKGRSLEAVAEYRRALSIDQNFAPAHLDLGIELIFLGEKAQAAKELREYLRMVPNTPENQMGIDLARDELRRLQK